MRFMNGVVVVQRVLCLPLHPAKLKYWDDFMDETIFSPSVAGFDSLNLQYLGKATIKTFDRLVPFSQLEDPSSVEAAPIVTKIVDKLQTYIQAIESSILAVEAIHRLSIDTAILCKQVEADTTAAEENQPSETAQILPALMVLATDACEQADHATVVFRQAEQDLFKIAATTKGLSAIVQVPADPAHPKTLQKTLQDVGSDLVANLGLLADFYKQISELAGWCRWIKAELSAANGSLATSVVPALDGTEEARHLQSITEQWNRVHKDSLAYYNLISDIQEQYPKILSVSRKSWRIVTGKDEKIEESQADSVINKPPARSAVKRLAQKTTNLARSAVRHLTWCGCFGP